MNQNIFPLDAELREIMRETDKQLVKISSCIGQSFGTNPSIGEIVVFSLWSEKGFKLKRKRMQNVPSGTGWLNNNLAHSLAILA